MISLKWKQISKPEIILAVDNMSKNKKNTADGGDDNDENGDEDQDDPDDQDDGLNGIELGDTSPQGEAFKAFQKYCLSKMQLFMLRVLQWV